VSQNEESRTRLLKEVFLSKEDFLKGTQLPESWDCIDCGVNTAPGCSSRAGLKEAFSAGLAGVIQRYDRNTEMYTVRDAVWAEAEMQPDSGCLCIGCLEQRLGRKLRPKDFRKDDGFTYLQGTDRLLKRRGKRKGEP